MGRHTPWPATDGTMKPPLLGPQQRWVVHSSQLLIEIWRGGLPLSWWAAGWFPEEEGGWAWGSCHADRPLLTLPCWLVIPAGSRAVGLEDLQFGSRQDCRSWALCILPRVLGLGTSALTASWVRQLLWMICMNYNSGEREKWWNVTKVLKCSLRDEMSEINNIASSIIMFLLFSLIEFKIAGFRHISIITFDSK